MKIKKSVLKRIIIEELKSTMNEMAIDEMAFSMADVSAAQSDVDMQDSRFNSAEADEEYSRLIAQFITAINDMGGTYVVDPSDRLSRKDLNLVSDPYSKELSVIYKVLVNEAEKLHHWSGAVKLKQNPKGLVYNSDPNPGRTLQDHAERIVYVLESIAEYAKSLDGLNGVNSDEPFLSIENADYNLQVATKLRTDWVAELARGR
jgi:hypothetical protein